MDEIDVPPTREDPFNPLDEEYYTNLLSVSRSNSPKRDFEESDIDGNQDQNDVRSTEKQRKNDADTDADTGADADEEKEDNEEEEEEDYESSSLFPPSNVERNESILKYLQRMHADVIGHDLGFSFPARTHMALAFSPCLCIVLLQVGCDLIRYNCPSQLLTIFYA